MRESLPLEPLKEGLPGPVPLPFSAHDSSSDLIHRP